MMKEYDLVAIGDINVDTIVIVPKLPESDEEIRVLSLSESIGGDAANVAVGFALLGGRSLLLGAIGEDLAGRKAVDFFVTKNVDTCRIISVPGSSTGRVISIVDADGQRRMLHWRGANAERLLTEEDLRVLKNSSVIYIADPLPSTVRVLRDWYSSNALSVPLVMDPGAGGVAGGMDFLGTLLQFTDILFLNRLEAQRLTGEENIMAAGTALAKLCPLVVIKLGGNGSVAFWQGKYVYAPAFKVQPLDSTGCGDAFNAAFLFQWLQGQDLETALKWGNAAGATVVQKMGAQMPTLDEVLSLLERGTCAAGEDF